MCSVTYEAIWFLTSLVAPTYSHSFTIVVSEIAAFLSPMILPGFKSGDIGHTLMVLLQTF